MHIPKCILVILCLIEISFADLKNFSRPHEQPATICFKNETALYLVISTLLSIYLILMIVNFILVMRDTSHQKLNSIL